MRKDKHQVAQYRLQIIILQPQSARSFTGFVIEDVASRR